MIPKHTHVTSPGNISGNCQRVSEVLSRIGDKWSVLIVMLLGFSSGLPLALSGSTLLVWMRESGVDLGTIGLFALVGTPYTLKFLWAPLTDALHVPLFTRAFGRRRGWLLCSQLFLIVSILLLAGIAINALAASFLAPLRSLLSSAQNMQVVGAHLERIDAACARQS